jgi:hypothetical protein
LIDSSVNIKIGQNQNYNETQLLRIYIDNNV